jgi:eRF1 domain 3
LTRAIDRTCCCTGARVSGGENGFNQAIELSADTLANVKFVQEKRLISKFFDEISQDTGKFVFGVHDTLTCLEMGAVETLIVYENLEVNRLSIMNPVTGGRLAALQQRRGQVAMMLCATHPGVIGVMDHTSGEKWMQARGEKKWGRVGGGKRCWLDWQLANEVLRNVCVFFATLIFFLNRTHCAALCTDCGCVMD